MLPCSVALKFWSSSCPATLLAGPGGRAHCATDVVEKANAGEYFLFGTVSRLVPLAYRYHTL